MRSPRTLPLVALFSLASITACAPAQIHGDAATDADARATDGRANDTVTPTDAPNGMDGGADAVTTNDVTTPDDTVTGTDAPMGTDVPTGTDVPMSTDGGTTSSPLPPVLTDPLQIIPTSYPIPTGAIFVSVSTGSDTNAGTEAAPLRTAAEAIRRSRQDRMNTIVFREGEYRESLTAIFKPVTIQPYPGEHVWFKGSAEVASNTFVADGSAWRLDNWNPGICRSNCVSPPSIVTGYPLAADPEMVFFDGHPLTQVATRAEVAANTFFWDGANNRIYVGTNPVAHRVEISNLRYAMQFDTMYGEHSVVRGIGVVQYATSQDYAVHPAALITTSASVTFENNVIAYNAAAGIQLSSADDVVRGNLIALNGFNGMHTYHSDRAVIEGNRFVRNNTEHFGLVASDSLAGAAIKATYTHGAILRDNVLEETNGAGFWCDLSCYQWQLVRNVVRDNTTHGIFWEISSQAVIASNVITGSGGYGIKISGSNQAQIYNNTVVANHQAILVAEDDRPYTSNCSNVNCPTAADVALGIDWNTSRTTIVNNLFVGGSSTSWLFDTLDNNMVGSAQRVGANGMILANGQHHNGYYRTSSGVPATLFKWIGLAANPTLYSTLAMFQTATSREMNSVYIEGGQSFFVDAANRDYRVAAGSSALDAGAALPADVAMAIGVSGSPVSMGAIRWPGGP